VYDGRAFAQHLFAIKNVAFTRILWDQGIYVCMLIFAARLRHLIRQAHGRPNGSARSFLVRPWVGWSLWSRMA
jgi:hypothetical protein